MLGLVSNMKTINLTEADNNKTIQVSKGDKVVITLPFSASNGFFWQNRDSTAGELEELKHEGEDTKPGATTFVIFTFSIHKSGVLILSYARPWAEKEPPAKWFEVKVVCN